MKSHSSKPKDTRTLFLYVDTPMHEWLKVHANRLRKPMGAIVRKLLEDYKKQASKEVSQ